MRRWRYTSKPPADLPIDTSRDTGNTVLITQTGEDSPVTIPAKATHALGMNQPLTSEMKPHTGPIFAAGGAKRADVRRGTRPYNTELIDNLEQIADINPEELDEAFHDYEDGTPGKHDGTVGVRFFVDATPHWTRVDRKLLYDPAKPDKPMHIDHTDGDAMWAPLLYKAYEILRHKIKKSATVSLRPFSPPIDPTTLPPPAPMPRTTVQAPTDRLSIVDTNGNLFSAKLGEVVTGTPDPQNPNIYWLHVEPDDSATRDPPQPIHRDLLPASDIGSKGEYRAEVTIAGLRWMDNNIPRRLPDGQQAKLGLDSPGFAILDGNTLITESAMEALGRTVLHPRKKAKIFHVSDGKPHAAPRDIIQRTVGDCFYLGSLGSMAASNPRAAPAMLYQYPNDTIVIRRFMDRDYNPIWEPITTDLWADANGRPLYAFYDHENDGENTPLWPALFEKALANKQGGDYMEIHGGNPARVLDTLLPPYTVVDFGSIHQPTRVVNFFDYLHPMRFGVDTLHDLLRKLLGRKPDRKFAQRLGQLEQKWRSELTDETVKNFAVAFEEFLRKHLLPDEIDQWSAEIEALNGYVADTYDPDKPFTSKIAREHVTDFIRYLVDSGDTIVLSTRPFGGHMENHTRYPGLLGHHSYSLVDVEQHNGEQVTLRLRDPNGRHTTIHPILDGITHGADGTLSVDLKHLNKFITLTSHGTGIQFALGGPDPTKSQDWNRTGTALTTTPEQHNPSESRQSPDTEHPQPLDTTASHIATYGTGPTPPAIAGRAHDELSAKERDRAERMRIHREMMRARPITSDVELPVRPGGDPDSAPAYHVGSYIDMWGNPVRIVRIRMHVSADPAIPQNTINRFLAKAQLATDARLNNGRQKLRGKQFVIDLIPVPEPAHAHVEIRLAAPSAQHGLDPDSSLNAIADLLREHIGLPRGPTHDGPGFSDTDLQRLDADIPNPQPLVDEEYEPSESADERAQGPDNANDPEAPATRPSAGNAPPTGLDHPNPHLQRV
ncbi:MAG: hypothetical protein J2P17_10625, partial [Mycobacterium sp.]|nr:hypothetical protein [Mycobacterium sp.]